MKLAIAGDYRADNVDIVIAALDAISEPIEVIITGSSKGLCKALKRHGRLRGIRFQVSKPTTLPKHVGLKAWTANVETLLVRECDAIIYVGGAAHSGPMSFKAKNLKKPFVRIPPTWKPVDNVVEVVDERARRIAARYGEEI